MNSSSHSIAATQPEPQRAIADEIRGARQTAETIEDRLGALLIRLRGARPAEVGVSQAPASEGMVSSCDRLCRALGRASEHLDEIEKLV